MNGKEPAPETSINHILQDSGQCPHNIIENNNHPLRQTYTNQVESDFPGWVQKLSW